MNHLSSVCGLIGCALLAALPFGALAQTGIGTTAPNAKAVLDISSADKGLLIPRLDSVQRVAIAAPPDGLMVFQKDGRVGLWYAFGGQWLYIPDKVRSSDNLGSHTATQNLNLGAFKLVGNGGTTGLVISNSGNVGVGTTSPITRLDVAGTTRTTGLLMTVGATNGRVLTSDAGGNATWQAPAAVGLTNVSSPLTGNGVGTPLAMPAATSAQNGYLSSTDWVTFNNKGTFTLPALTNGSVTFSNGTTLAQNNANLFWDNPNQRLGLGTNAPTARLEVVGAIKSNALVSNAAGALSSFGPLDVGQYYVGGGHLQFVTNGANRMRLDGSGSLGIGTTTPAASALLDVASTTKGFLPPRMTTTQRDLIGAPTDGLTIFNTTTDCLETYINGRWRNYCNGNCDPEAVGGAIAAGPVQYCSGGTPPPIAAGTLPSGGLASWTYQWQLSTDGGTTWAGVSGATAATYAPPAGLTGTPVYRRVELNPCGAVFYSNSCPFTPVSGVPALPVIASAPTVTQTCAAQVGTLLTYSVTPVATATSYTWNLPAHLAAVGPATGATIQVQVLAEANAVFSVTANNACGTSPARSLSIVMLASTPTSISAGPYTYCAGTYSYSVTPVLFGVPYQWSYSGTGATITPTSGAGTAITITFAAGATAGALSVRSSNPCGVSAPYSVPFTGGAAIVGSISTPLPPTILCPGGTASFSVQTQSGATGYLWSYSGTGATLTNQTTTTVTVQLSATATAGTLSVAAFGACGPEPGQAATYDIDFGIPAQPGAITGPSPISRAVAGAFFTYSVPSVDNVRHTWTLTPATATLSVFTSSRNSCLIRVNSTSAPVGTYTLTATPVGCGGNGPVRTMSVVVQ